MTTAEMLAHVRMKLDEDSAAFWSDAQIYQSLTNGQLQLSTILVDKESPLANPLIKNISASYSTTTEPSDMLKPIGLEVSSVPYLIRTGKRFDKERNSYLAGTASSPYVYFYKGYLDFDPTLIAGTYTLEYYKLPDDIDSGVEPTLRSQTHPAIVQYAVADLLLRDEKFQEASLEFNEYEKMVAKL